MSAPPTVIACLQILCIWTNLSVNMCKYVPPTKLCMCWGLCGQQIRFFRMESHSKMILKFRGSFKAPELVQESKLWKFKTWIYPAENRTMVKFSSQPFCYKCMRSPINPAWFVIYNYHFKCPETCFTPSHGLRTISSSCPSFFIYSTYYYSSFCVLLCDLWSPFFFFIQSTSRHVGPSWWCQYCWAL